MAHRVARPRGADVKEVRRSAVRELCAHSPSPICRANIERGRIEAQFTNPAERGVPLGLEKREVFLGTRIRWHRDSVVEAARRDICVRNC